MGVQLQSKVLQSGGRFSGWKDPAASPGPQTAHSRATAPMTTVRREFLPLDGRRERLQYNANSKGDRLGANPDYPEQYLVQQDDEGLPHLESACFPGQRCSAEVVSTS